MSASSDSCPAVAWPRRVVLLLFPLALVLCLAWIGAGGGEPLLAAAPAQTATPTLPPDRGAITGTAWNDLDGNGLHEPSEPPLPGMALTLRDGAGQVVGTAVTGSDGAYRFGPLTPGLYQLAATPPAGYRLTTQGAFNLFVSAGAVLVIEFGAQIVPTDTPTPTPVPRLDTDNAPFAFCGGVISDDTRAWRNNVTWYACRPAWSEEGPEAVYRIELGRSQPLTATLLSATGDLDLFLLKTAFPDTCLAAGDNYLTYTVQPGVYFLAVDGYRGAAGPFTVRLDCPYGEQATPTPTPTPSPTPSPPPTRTPTATPSPTATREPSRLYLPHISFTLPGPTPEPVTVTFQQGNEGYAGVTDTWLSAWEPDRAFGSFSLLRLRYNQPPQNTSQMEPVLRFDLMLLPTEAHIVRATLRLYLVTIVQPTHDLTGAVHGLLRPWDVDTATWNQSGTGQPWTKPGAQAAGQDYSATASDIQNVQGAGRWIEFDVTDLTQGWVRDGDRNFGVIILAQAGQSASNVEASFASSEYATAGLRPQLVVTYWVRTQ